MFEKYFVKPETIETLQESWIFKLIENYVAYLDRNDYSPQKIKARVPVLRQFGEFSQKYGCKNAEELPQYVDSFVNDWVNRTRRKMSRKHKLANEIRGPVEQMLRRYIPGFVGRGHPKAELPIPFIGHVPQFFNYLISERGLKDSSLHHYEIYCEFTRVCIDSSYEANNTAFSDS